VSPDQGGMAEQVAALRRDFDASFAAEAAAPAHDLLAVLLVRACGQLQAVPVSGLVSVERCPALVALPRQHAAVLGLAATRGRPATVFSLDRLLGAAGSDAPARWLLFLQAQVAVAVSGIEGHRHVAPEAVLRDREGRAQPLINVGATSWPLVDLPSFVKPLLAPEPLRAPTPKE
jgi:chemotaxis signal transduction protein